MTRRRRSLRIAAGMASVGLATMWTTELVWAQDLGGPVSLIGSGTSSIMGELTIWQDEMAAASAPTDVQYFAVGTLDGRDKFLRGDSDFVISAPPFTPEQLAGQPVGSAEILTVPISVNAPAVVMTTRAAATNTLTLTCDPDDPANPDPEACIVRGTFAGPFRLPTDNFAAFALNVQPDFEANGLRSWAHPSVTAALGTQSMQMQQLPYRYHTFVNRTEGEADNFYVQDYIKSMAPGVWAIKQREMATAGWAWEPIREILPPRWVTSRFGLDTVIGVVSLADFNAEGGSAPDRWVGNMMLVPSTMLAKVRADHPGVTYDVVQLQNANNEWVEPTAEAVTAALSAGTAPNIAARQAVPGGYPLTWVNNLSVRATGLSPAKAGSLAALIRYLVTTGQDSIVAHGGARLPAAEVSAALAAADQLVANNCSSPDFEVVDGGRGAYEPALPGLDAIATMKHCQVAPPVTTTTTTEPPAPPPPAPRVPAVVVPAATIPVPAATLPPIETVPVTVVVETTTTIPPPTTPPPPPYILAYEDPPEPNSLLAGLPMPLPDDGRGGFKKLGTFLLGAGGFLAAGRVKLVRFARAR